MSKGENLNKLPEMCAAINSVTREGMLIKRGEVGYYPAPQFKTQKDCDDFNNHLGITKEQLRAMEAGSIFGFHVDGANPDNWKGKI